MNTTIAAIATPPGRGGIGVLRLSGPKAYAIAEQLTQRTLPQPRYAALRYFYDHHGQILDQGLLLCFAAHASFTGELVVEVQGHGGPVVMDLLLQRLLMLGATMARPGEFSERAFINGRMDLAQAEAVADLIDAASAHAVRAASRSLQGVFSRQIDAMVEALIGVRVYLEAALDFSEEEVDWLNDSQLLDRANKVEQQLGAIIASSRQGMRLQEGMRLIIVGRPNVGKSSLLNALSAEDTAIVSEQAGTTRDVLRAHIVLDGLPIQVIDTAGLRDSKDRIEQEGIRRALAAMEQADAALWLTDIHDPNPQWPLTQPCPAHLPILQVVNKADLQPDCGVDPQALLISVKQHQGMTTLRQRLKDLVGFAPTEGEFTARRRHVDALQQAYSHVQQARLLWGDYPELIAEEWRQAQQALQTITGQFNADDLLGRVFSSFCIGK